MGQASSNRGASHTTGQY